MKIYLASSFSLAPKVKHVCEVLEDEGFEVICKWWTGLDYIPFEKKTLKEHAQEVSPAEFYSHPACKNAFDRDLKGVKDCDALVFVASDKIRPYCGANVEIGIAFAFNKFVYSIGVFKNSAMYYGIRRCSDIHDVIEKLKNWSGIPCPKLDCNSIMEGGPDGYWCPRCEEYYPPDIIEEWITENA